MSRGYFGIGIEHCKNPLNIGTLWRSANLFGAAFIFTVHARYRTQSSDTYKTPRHIPLFHFPTLDDLVAHLPMGCPLVGVELTPKAYPIGKFIHPERAAYLLGAEDHGLTNEAMDRCHSLVQLPGAYSMNVSSAGTVVMYDRHTKREAA